MGEAAIEETVMSILKVSDLETATELSIRTITAQRLGVDRFSFDQKRLIRSLIESFLLQTESRTPSEVARGENNGVRGYEVAARGPNYRGRQLGAAARGTNSGEKQLDVAARGRNDGGKQSEVAARVTNYGGQQSEVAARGTNSGGQPLDVAARGTNSGVQQLNVAARGTNGGVQPLEVAARGTHSGVRQLEVPAVVTNYDGNGLQEFGMGAGGTNKDGGNGVQELEKAAHVMNNDVGNEVQELEMAARGMSNDGGNGVQELEARGMNKDRGNGVRELEMAACGMNDGGCNDAQRLEVGENSGVVLGLEVPQDHHQEGGGGGGGDYVEDGNSRIICELSQSRDVTVHDFRGQSMVTIRDRYQNNGMPLPKIRRTSLTAEQWLSIKNNIPAVEDAITRMQTRLRLPAAGKQSDPYVSRPVVASARGNVTGYSEQMDSFYSAQESILEGSKQMEVEPTRPPSGFLHMPIRLDGKNYYLWRHQMAFLLAESKVAYVLTEACPSISATIEVTRKGMGQEKAFTQKWAEDDFICRQKILTSLCDNLYNDYSRKACNAKELWEELKSVYDEDIGTRRSKINKYVQFQIVDGVSILEQVHELHSISQSVCASGTWIDEYFHVSLIISKLPPSWKEFRLRMMQKEVLPLDMLIHFLKVEEDARNTKQLGKHSKPNVGSKSGVGSKCESRVGSQGKERRRLCYNCKKAGHISNNCPDRKTDVSDNGNAKENGGCPEGGQSYKWVRDLP